MVPPNFQKQQHMFSSQKIHQSNIKIPQDFQKQQHCTLLSPQACTQPIILASAGGQDQQQHRMIHSHMPGMQQSVWPCNEFISPQLFHKTTDKKITGLPNCPQQNGVMIKQQKPSTASPDGAYERLQTTWNNHLLELNKIYNIVLRSSQNPGLAKQFQEIKTCADDTTKALRLSWPQFKTLSCDQIQKITKRVKAIEAVINKFNNRCQLPSQSRLPQPQPQQRMNMKVETSEESYIDLQTNRQTFEKQNRNQPIQKTAVNPKKQLMSPHRISAVNGSSFSQRARSIPGILQPQHSVGQLKEPSTHIESYSVQASSQLHWVNRTSPLSTVGTSFQNVVASEPDRASKNSPLLVKSTTSPPICPLPAAGSNQHSLGHVEDAQILSPNRNQSSSSTGTPPEMQEETNGSALVSRLLDAAKSMSNKALCSAADDIASVMNDTIGGVACPRRVKRPFDEIYASSQVTYSEAHTTKMPKFEQHKTLLLDEIRETNKRFVETTLDVVSYSKFVGGSGSTVVRCSYNPVGPCSRLLPPFSVELLVPEDYPQSSPLLLKDSSSVQESHLKEKVKMRFSLSLGQLSQLPSLKEIARKWDDCARSVLTEFAVSTGGGSFSTKYGKWENILCK